MFNRAGVYYSEDTTTGKQGQYSIAYHRPRALNLLVRAYDASGKVIAASATVFAAAAQIQINLTTAASGVVRKPSVFTNLEAAVAAQLQGTPLSDLKENKDLHELHFLASAAGAGEGGDGGVAPGQAADGELDAGSEVGEQLRGGALDVGELAAEEEKHAVGIFGVDALAGSPGPSFITG